MLEQSKCEVFENTAINVQMNHWLMSPVVSKIRWKQQVRIMINSGVSLQIWKHIMSLLKLLQQRPKTYFFAQMITIVLTRAPVPSWIVCRFCKTIMINSLLGVLHNSLWFFPIWMQLACLSCLTWFTWFETTLLHITWRSC